MKPIRFSPILALLGVLVGCAAEESVMEPPDRSPVSAKAPAGPTVTATDPSQTEQGTTLDVRVLGSGFDNGSKVTLLLQGTPTSKVVTNSTRYVSGKELVANLSVTLDAVTASYDVQVITSRGKKGIGTEKFEIRTITELPTFGGTAGAQGINGAGLVTGGANDPSGFSKPFVWSETTGIVALPLPPGYLRGRGRSINGAKVIAGSTSIGMTERPAAWIPSGSSWVVQFLGTFGSPDSAGDALDINESSTIVGGSEIATGQGRPFRWTAATGMIRLPLPQGEVGSGQARGINGPGDIVGFVNIAGVTSAVAWPASGGVVVLPIPAGYTTGTASGINDLGVAVGKVCSRLPSGASTCWGARWRPASQPGQWLPPELLAYLGRGEFEDIDNSGRIIGWGEDSPGSRAVLWQDGGGLTELGGLTKTSTEYAKRINNPDPGRLVQVPGSSDDKAVVWDLR